jgi:hypothetical protein
MEVQHKEPWGAYFTSFRRPSEKSVSQAGRIVWIKTTARSTTIKNSVGLAVVLLTFV